MIPKTKLAEWGVRTVRDVTGLEPEESARWACVALWALACWNSCSHARILELEKRENERGSR